MSHPTGIRPSVTRLAPLVLDSALALPLTARVVPRRFGVGGTAGPGERRGSAHTA